MTDLNFLGADGGRLAMSFASGCIATFAFMSTVGAFIWGLVGKHKQDRIDQLAADLAAEKTRCTQMENRLVSRIEQLETVLLFETVGKIRQDAQISISEIHERIRFGVEKEAREIDD